MYKRQKKDLPTGVCLFAMVTVPTKVFGIVKSAFVIPVGQSVCLHLFGDGSGACHLVRYESH